MKSIQRESTNGDSVVLTRRQALQAAGSLVLGMVLPHASAGIAPDGTGPAGSLSPNAFLKVDADGTVTVVSKHIEMGQGTYTGIATLIAEELDADWASVKVIGAPADTAKYKNLFWGIQGTGGSNSIANSYEQMRKAGATARAMLVAAAASKWGTSPSDIKVSKGVLTHLASGRQATFGELAGAAALLPVPEQVALKDPKTFTLIGKEGVRRADTAAKTDGTALFTQDIKLPGMMVAVVVHARRFGASIKSLDATQARQVPDVVAVIQIPSINGKSRAGVAVLAKSTWAAKKASDALAIEWDEDKAFKLSSAQIFDQYRAMASKPGAVARRDGDVNDALAKASKVLDAEYTFPYLAHAPMEPLNCVIHLKDDRCEMWNGEQWQTADQARVAQVCGVPTENVTIHALYAGGSFGRRANPFSDYVVEAAYIAKAARDQGLSGPIKMVWTREEDMTGGYYRPLNLHVAKFGLDAKGDLIAWQQRIVGQSIFRGTAFEKLMVKNGIDHESVVGADDLPYGVPNLLVDLHTPDDISVPIQWYRSVGHTHTAFSTESVVDEAAAAAGKDPVEFRRKLLAAHKRHQGVLDLVAKKSAWGTKLEPGSAGSRRGRGVAVHESFKTYVAQVVEVTVRDSGEFSVDRVVCAVDCGVAVNPDVVRAQMEGGIGFALSMALHGEITLKDGVVEQRNFHQYRLLRMNEMPRVEVHIVDSAEKPSGVGEPGVPPLAPALANALFAATGRRLRNLPFGTRI